MPQGSHLGPLLFSLSVFQYCNCLLCADDVKVFLKVESSSGAFRFRHDLNNLAMRHRTNHMTLNIAKYKVLRFKKLRGCIHIQSTVGVVLNEIYSVGIHMISGSHSPHPYYYDNIARKASRALGFIMKSFSEFKNPSTFKILY